MPCDDCSRAETCPPCVNGLDGTRTADMHAILVGLLSVSHTPEQADHAAREVLGQHARQLAEKQRTWLASQGYEGPCVCGGCSWCLLQDPIDLIDPKAEV